MTGFLKLLFDMCFYYSLCGFYFTLFSGNVPGIAGFVYLAAVTALNLFLCSRGRQIRVVQGLVILAPVTALLTSSPLSQAIYLIPVCAYLAFSLFTGRTETDYDDFKHQFSVTLRLLLLILPGLFFSGGTDALGSVMPYLIGMLACGVCMMRMLREDMKNSPRQAIYILLFAAVCILLTVFKAPQALVRAAGAFYQNILGPLIMVVVLIFAYLVGGIVYLVTWIVSRFNSESEPVAIDMTGAAEILGIEESTGQTSGGFPAWLRTLFIALGIILLAVIVFLMLRRLLGNRSASVSEKVSETQGIRSVVSNREVRIPKYIKPSNPRLAVRYYYARFLRECQKCGCSPDAGMTSAELVKYCESFFPGVDLSGLTELYAPARYSSREPVSQEAAAKAAALWREIKQCRKHA